MGGPITADRLKCCDWSPHKFIVVNFSKLTDYNQIFRIDFVSIHYHLCKIIQYKIFGPYELTITITTLWLYRVPRTSFLTLSLSLSLPSSIVSCAELLLLFPCMHSQALDWKLLSSFLVIIYCILCRVTPGVHIHKGWTGSCFRLSLSSSTIVFCVEFLLVFPFTRVGLEVAFFFPCHHL